MPAAATPGETAIVNEDVPPVMTERRAKPRAYYGAVHAYQRGRAIVARRRGTGGRWQGVRIFGYHRVASEWDLLAVRPQRFREQMEAIADADVEPIRLDRALDLLERGEPIEGRYVCVTFDDGYLDNLEHAVPVLERLGIPATIYLPTRVIDGVMTYHWYENPPRPMSWSQVESLVAGGLVDVQAHTVRHIWLPLLSDAEVEQEIVGSKREVEAHVPYAVSSFAYPAGRFGRRELALVRGAGYRGAVTTDPGVNDGTGDVMALRRTMSSWFDSRRHFQDKLDGLLDTDPGLRALLHGRRPSERLDEGAAT